jgi:hypothetical protein
VLITIFPIFVLLSLVWSATAAAGSLRARTEW